MNLMLKLFSSNEGFALYSFWKQKGVKNFCDQSLDHAIFSSIHWPSPEQTQVLGDLRPVAVTQRPNSGSGKSTQL